MALFQVTQTQTVTYTWYVDADTEDEAEASDKHGVPDEAWSRVRASDTLAALVDNPPDSLKADIVLDVFSVAYSMTAPPESREESFAASIIVRALDADTAADVAFEFLYANEPAGGRQIAIGAVTAAGDVMSAES